MATATPPPAGPATATHRTAAHATTSRRVRVHVGELICAGCAIGLLIVFFAMAWYGVAGVPNPTAAEPALSGVETGWQALSLIRWVALVTAIVALGSVVLHATQRSHGTRTDTSRLLLGLGLLTTLLLIWRVLIAFPSPEKVISQKLGALLGLFFAVGIAYGGHESLIELRDRRRLARPRHRTQTHAVVPRPSGPVLDRPDGSGLVQPRDTAGERAGGEPDAGDRT